MCHLSSLPPDCDVDLDNLPPVLNDGMIGNLARRLYGGDRRPVVFGTLLGQMALRRVVTMFDSVHLNAATDQTNARLVSILTSCANHCPFDKFGDEHMHAKIRLLLPSYEEAALGCDKPYEAMDRTFSKDDSIRLIRPMFESMPAQHIDNVDWSAMLPSQLALVCGVLAEHLDGAHPRLTVNGGFLSRLKDTDPTIFAFVRFGDRQDGIGVAFKDKLFFAAPKWPIASIIQFWAEHTPAAREFYTALSDPSSLAPTSRFKKMLERK